MNVGGWNGWWGRREADERRRRGGECGGGAGSAGVTHFNGTSNITFYF